MSDTLYDLVMFFESSDHDSRVIQCDLSLEEAQAICSEDNSSSESTTSVWGKSVTDRYGRWFIGYRSQ